MSSLSPNLSLFTNVQPSTYWLNTEPATINSVALLFNTTSGAQMGTTKNANLYAWAVLSGDVAFQVIPGPSIFALLGIGLFGFMLKKKIAS